MASTITHTGELTINVVEARGLREKCECMLLLFVNGQEVARTKSTGKKTTDPFWNQPLVLDLENVHTIQFEVSDRDHLVRKGKSTFGVGLLPMPLLTDPDQDFWVDVSSGGSVHFQYTYIPRMFNRRGSSDSTNGEPGTLNPTSRRLYVKICSARNLMAKAAHGTTDAYCVIEVGKKSKRTSVVEKTINPEWNEAFVIDAEKDIKTRVKISVFDVNGETFLGQLRLDFNDIPTVKEGDQSTASKLETEKWRDLEKRSMRSNVRGMLLTDVYFLDPPAAKIERSGSKRTTITKAPSKKEVEDLTLPPLSPNPTGGAQKSPDLTDKTRLAQSLNRPLSLPSSPRLRFGRSDSVSSLGSRGSNGDEDETLPVSTAPPKLCICAKIIEARDLPQFPAAIQPRTYASVSVNEHKSKTKAVGERQEYGGMSHSAPKWAETIILPVTDVNDNVDIKVYTTITSHILSSMDNVVGKIRFPLAYVPYCEDGLDDSVLDDNKTNSFNLDSGDAGGKSTDVIPQPLSQGELRMAGNRPAKFWLKLDKPKKRLPLPLKTGGGRGQLCLVLALIPAPDELDLTGEDEDAGDPDGASPMALPQPYQWNLIEEEMPCSATKLHSTIFANESSFLMKFFHSRNYKDIEIGTWAPPLAGGSLAAGPSTGTVPATNGVPAAPTPPTGVLPTSQSSGAVAGVPKGHVRIVKYVMPPSSIVKAASATETQVCQVVEPGGSVIDVTTETPDVPFGTSFQTKVQICINRVDGKRCILRVTAMCHFLKSSMMRGAIEKGGQQGLKQTYTEFAKSLRDQLTKKKGQRKVDSKVSVEETAQKQGLLQRLALGTVAVPASAVAIVLILLLASTIVNLSLYRAVYAMQPQAVDPTVSVGGIKAEGEDSCPATGCADPAQ
eukprot:comp19419_c0_seq1/m.22503 comp19419_c0_seq1/g.22503  ORF comp19419_c0_seq1/g.22503 comp19419_c0_seq1/m.22503 type:complete len:892 (-) comp19419_c0_seq1:9-2684(-)